MQNKGRSSTVVVLMGEHDKATTLEYDDMSVDMDTSPINSPNNCTDLRNNLETKPPEPHYASGMVLSRTEYGSLNSCSYCHNCLMGTPLPFTVAASTPLIGLNII
ncbi:hypothetical protein NC653_007243 [Populus alba x Populus x berolinensis]|uniref:Uncharacterized protein n=1 Tax=Populus alba x Populus x berolinensis TaxID=444605 RepID=A0AAD6WD97_9ROSI|nr:hypothetical protein NC653_007243 [Populus alba x Populus x berolinensis]